MDLVVADVVARVKHDDAVRVVEDVVVLDPAVPALDAEDPFAPRPEDQVVQNHRVAGVRASVRYVCFVVLENLVFFNVRAGRVYQQNSLPVVAKYLVVQNLHTRALTDSDACLSV